MAKENNIKTLVSFLVITFFIFFVSCSSPTEEIVNLEKVKEAQQLYPLQLNNIWVYEVLIDFSSLSENPGISDTLVYYEKYKIVETKKWEGIKFYKFVEETIFPDSIYDEASEACVAPHYFMWAHSQWQGVSFPETKFYFDILDLSYIYSYFDFMMKLGEKRYDDDVYSYGATVSVVDIGNEHIFNKNRQFKVYNTQAAYHQTTNKYVNGLGLFSGTFSEECNYKNGSFQLKGCVINRIVYGDTSLVF